MKHVLGHHAQHRIAFVGEFGVGKTTALRAISDVAVVDTEVCSSELGAQQLREGKTATTVALDYGQWRFPDGSVVELLGVPGQRRFAAAWGILLPRASAVVLWLFGDRCDMLENCRFWLDVLAQHRVIGQLAVAVTRIPADAPDDALSALRLLVAQYHPWAPVITADPREPEQVMQAVMVALSTPCANP